MNSICIRDVLDFVESNGATFREESRDTSISLSNVLLTSPNAYHEAADGEFSFLSHSWKGRKVDQTHASLILTDDTSLESQQDQVVVYIEQPRFWFAKICQFFFPPLNLDILVPAKELLPELKYKGQIGANCNISEYAFLNPNVYIGNDTVIHPGVSIYGNSFLSDGVIVEPSAVVGKSGFAFERMGNQIVALPHYGGVRIGSNVRVGSQACIDRGTFGNTEVSADAMVDNLVHVAHNVIVRERTLVVAGSVLCGSSKIGSDAWIGAGAMVRESIIIGDKAFVGMGAVVISNVDEAEVVVGNPARRLKSE